MFRLHQSLSQSELVSGFIAPFFTRSETHQSQLIAIPVAADELRHDRPQRLSSRRRKSRVEVQTRGV